MNGHPIRPNLGLPDVEVVVKLGLEAVTDRPIPEDRASPRSPRCDSVRHGPGLCDCTASGAFVISLGGS
ncbi:MAG: hypothetical protein JNN01_16305 [Opitutaceae bacterium]|nr:hypothetical protein [Opitutaceae bacterium]